MRPAILLALLMASPLEGGAPVPRVDLRASPRMSLAPTTVYAVLELKGGEDLEDFYCPSIEWEWDDGGRSLRESDCAPFDTGTRIERVFSADHFYKRGGSYQIQVTLRKGTRVIRRASASIVVRSGFYE